MSRGRVKPSLTTLSREALNPADRSKFWAELIAQNPRASAMLGAALIDRALVIFLLTKMRAFTQTEVNKLFFEDGAILGTLAARVELAYALELITLAEKDILRALRKIRNSFAHTLRPIDFDHPLITEQCAILMPLQFINTEELLQMNQNQRRYVETSITIASRFKALSAPHPRCKEIEKLVIVEYDAKT